MAQQTVTALFDRYEDASAAVAKLEAGGIPHGDISLVGNNEGDRHAGLGGHDGTHVSADTKEKAKDGTGTGATLGTVVGGAAGLLAGLGLLAIPGVGPVVAAGWLVASLTGAGGGAAAVKKATRRGRSRRSASGALISICMTIGAPQRCVTPCSAISRYIASART